MIVGDGWLACRDYFFLAEFFRGVVFALLVAVVAGLGCMELLGMGKGKGMRPGGVVLVMLVGAVTTEQFWSYWFEGYQVQFLATVLMAGLLLGGLWQGKRYGARDTFVNLGMICLGVIYLGLGSWFLVQLRLLGSGGETVWGQIGPLVMAVACIKSADIGAYFTGRFLGRHKWVPSISPGKTWEGFGGGVLLAVIVASLFGSISGIMCIRAAILFGVIMAVTGQLGDLLESMLKRDALSKDSGRLVPEFGGVLDMLDSPLVAGPFAYWFFVYLNLNH